jgi:pimeloyl-ACP methyl ester carboxylesterase
MRAFGRTRQLTACVAGLAGAALAGGRDPGVYADDLEVVSRGGKTYVTFEKVVVATNERPAFLVYRSLSPITSVSNLTPVARVPFASHAHPDNGTPFIPPRGVPLTERKGFFVYTAKQAARAWYAVLAESTLSAKLVPEENVTPEAIAEEACSRPAALLQSSGGDEGWLADYYAMWMDHGTWPHDKEYYGSFFSMSYKPEDAAGAPKPVMVFLHALGMGRSGEPLRRHSEGFYTIWVNDYKRTWWEGRTEARIDAQIQYLLTCGKYNIDPERVYVSGNSMGGHGTVVLAERHPDWFAAAYAKIPSVGAPQYEAMTPLTPLPPLVTWWGFRDSGGHGVKGNVPLLVKMMACKQGVWSQWKNAGHVDPPGYDHSAQALPGGLGRFRRNELYPVFLHATTDANCGQKEEPVVPEGAINMQFDWASSLHTLGLKDEALVDEPARLAMTMRASEDAVVDVAFRRRQRFLPPPGTVLRYENAAVAAATNLQAGAVTVPEDGIFVVPRVAVPKGGCRLTITWPRP